MTDYTRQEVEDMALAAGYELKWETKVIKSPADVTIRDEPFRKVSDTLKHQGLWSSTHELWHPWDDKAQCFDLMVDASLVPRGESAQFGDYITMSWDSEDKVYYGDWYGVSKVEATMYAICRAAIEKGRAMREGE